MKNQETILLNQRQKREENREAFNAYYREYHAKNKEYRTKYINAHRKGRLKDATPIWADLPKIRNFYTKCPIGYHVDHIIPLHGELVSGLHVIENLQYLTAQENLSKGNYYSIHEKS